MKDFPKSREGVSQLAEELVRFLTKEMDATLPAPEWKAQNFELLNKFLRNVHCTECRFTGSTGEGEFLWDFHGYLGFKGMLITAESEYDSNHAEIAKDFDRLLYGISPLKLMICRIDKRCTTIDSAREVAEEIRVRLEGDIKRSSIQYCAGEVFILYCAWWWADADGERNRDFAYILQVDGDPNYVPVREEQHFEGLPN